MQRGYGNWRRCGVWGALSLPFCRRLKFPGNSAYFVSTLAEGLPSRMKAVVHQTDQPCGELGALRDQELPIPEIKPNEVLIQVRAAGVNRPDILQRRGMYPAPNGHSSLLGLEVAGNIVGIGSEAAAMAPQKTIHRVFQSKVLRYHQTSFGGNMAMDLPPDLAVLSDRGLLGSPVGWEIGAPVVALTNGGAYAEYVAVPAAQVLPQPSMNGCGGLPQKHDEDTNINNWVDSGVDWDTMQAAAVPETFFTVWHNLIYTAGLQPDEICLIHGGASGIGSTAIQLAKMVGAHVITTAGSEEKCKIALRLGASIAVDYNKQDFGELLKKSPLKEWVLQKTDLKELVKEALPEGVYVNEKLETDPHHPLQNVASSSRTWGTSTVFQSDTPSLPGVLPGHSNSLFLNRLSLVNLQRKLEGQNRVRKPLKHTPSGGVDVALDIIGGDYVKKNLSVLGDCGRLVNIAFLKGSKLGSEQGTEVDLTRMMLKRITMTGSTLRSRSDYAKAGIALDLYTYLWPHTRSIDPSKIVFEEDARIPTDIVGPLMDVKQPVDNLSAAYPLSAAGVSAAHERLESRKNMGKIVLHL